MKLSFSLASKSQSKKPATIAGVATTSDAAKAFESTRPMGNGSTVKEFVTEFDPSKPSSEALIIPPKPNEYRPFKKMRNLELPLTESAGTDSQPLQFELESASNDVEQGPNSISYGLNVRQSSASNGTSRVDPTLVKYKEDMGKLPDGPGFEEFEDMPVEGFGEALLAGYGWKQGRGIGRNAKEDVKIVEYKKWTGKEGLGFERQAPEKETSSIKDSKTGDGVRGGSDNGRREEKGCMDAWKEERAVGGREVDKTIENIPSSRRSDGDGRNDELNDSRKKERQHRVSEDVQKQLKDVRKEGRAADGRDGSRDRRDKMRENISSSRRSDRDSRDEELNDSRKKERKHRRSEDIEKQSNDVRERGHQQLRKSERMIWLCSHIRVRVISETVKGGRYYLKKGEVVDVVGPSCDILMDESRELVQGVSQEYLETALPKRGGPVLVLYGKHKGVYGSLVEKDADKETGVVRDADNHEMFHVRLEQIAEFIGDPSYIGY